MNSSEMKMKLMSVEAMGVTRPMPDTRPIAAYAKLKVEQALRERAEHQLRTLAESSPAAIVTLGHDGVVLSANRAAHDVLSVDAQKEALIGQRIDAYVPMFAQALTLSTRQIRNAAAGWARRANHRTRLGGRRW